MEVYSIGGFSEVGKNMVVVKINDDAFIFDCGLYIPAVIELQEENIKDYGERHLRAKEALPDDLILDKLGIRNKIRAIFLSHAHLDHLGAIPYIAHRYNAPIIGSPYTTAVLKKVLDDEKRKITNRIITVNVNSSYVLKTKTSSYTVELINMTHSVPHTTMIALHTPEGVVVYGNDFKIDNNPVLGLTPNYTALKKISKEGIKVAILDSLYCHSETKTPSENVARNMVKDVFSGLHGTRSAIFVSTFSSHIARLKSIIEFGKKLDREIIFMGRSLNRYVSAANEISVVNFKNEVRTVTYRNQVASMLKKIENNRDRYLVVCTGHQGEPGSILERLSMKKLHFQFRKDDNLIFSSKTIPVPVNIKNKTEMDKRFKKFGVRIFDEVHVSGHGGREDIRNLIEFLSPEHVIPSHGSYQRLLPMVELGKELGYKQGKNFHLLHNGQKLEI